MIINILRNLITVFKKTDLYPTYEPHLTQTLAIAESMKSQNFDAILVQIDTFHTILKMANARAVRDQLLGVRIQARVLSLRTELDPIDRQKAQTIVDNTDRLLRTENLWEVLAALGNSRKTISLIK